MNGQSSIQFPSFDSSQYGQPQSQSQPQSASTSPNQHFSPYGSASSAGITVNPNPNQYSFQPGQISHLNSSSNSTYPTHANIPQHLRSDLNNNSSLVGVGTGSGSGSIGSGNSNSGAGLSSSSGSEDSSLGGMISSTAGVGGAAGVGNNPNTNPKSSGNMLNIGLNSLNTLSANPLTGGPLGGVGGLGGGSGNTSNGGGGGGSGGGISPGPGQGPGLSAGMGMGMGMGMGGAMALNMYNNMAAMGMGVGMPGPGGAGTPGGMGQGQGGNAANMGLKAGMGRLSVTGGSGEDPMSPTGMGMNMNMGPGMGAGYAGGGGYMGYGQNQGPIPGYPQGQAYGHPSAQHPPYGHGQHGLGHGQNHPHPGQGINQSYGPGLGRQGYGGAATGGPGMGYNQPGVGGGAGGIGPGPSPSPGPAGATGAGGIGLGGPPSQPGGGPGPQPGRFRVFSNERTDWMEGGYAGVGPGVGVGMGAQKGGNPPSWLEASILQNPPGGQKRGPSGYMSGDRSSVSTPVNPSLNASSNPHNSTNPNLHLNLQPPGTNAGNPSSAGPTSPRSPGILSGNTSQSASHSPVSAGFQKSPGLAPAAAQAPGPGPIGGGRAGSWSSGRGSGSVGVDGAPTAGKTSTSPGDIAANQESGSELSPTNINKPAGSDGGDATKGGEKDDKAKNESGLPSNGSTTSMSSLAAERMIGKLVDDEVIPTAIVIKNIPFAVQKETLLAIIESLAAPLPYAFNYHHDNGVFRGLAFANFRQPHEADAVVVALNGYDISGRKLRVEYKKVLQAGEKERIERDKAIKRMRSMQFDRNAPAGNGPAHHNRHNNHGPYSGHGRQPGWNPNNPNLAQQPGGPAPLPNVPLTLLAGIAPQQVPEMSNQPAGRAPIFTPGQIPTPPLTTGTQGPNTAALVSPASALPVLNQALRIRTDSTNSTGSQTLQTGKSGDSAVGPGNMQAMQQQHLQQMQNAASHASSASSLGPVTQPSLGAATGIGGVGGQPMQPTVSNPGPQGNYSDVDFNDPVVLDIFSRALIFKEDRMRDEFAFSRNLSVKDRRAVHAVGEKLGLFHFSVGTEAERYVILSKVDPSRSGPLHRGQHRAPNGRTSSGGPSSFLSPYSPPPEDGSRPGSPGLRIKKSMPNMTQLNGPTVARDPHRLLPQRSNGNLRDYSTISSGQQSRRPFASHTGAIGPGGVGANLHGPPPVPAMPAASGNGGAGQTFNNLFGNALTNGTHDATSSPTTPSEPVLAGQGANLPGAPGSFVRQPHGPTSENKGFGARTPVRSKHESTSSLSGVNGVIGQRAGSIGGVKGDNQSTHTSGSSVIEEEADSTAAKQNSVSQKTVENA